MSQQQQPQIQLVCERLIDCFARRLQGETSLGISEEVQRDFIRVWREGTTARLERQAFAFCPTSGASPSADFGGSFGGEHSSAKRRKTDQAAESDDEFENAQVDSVGLVGEADEFGVFLSEEEKAFLDETELEAPPPLGDLTEAPRDSQTQDKIIGKFNKVLRPAEISRGLLTQERSAFWSFTLSHGLMKVGGQEFVVERLNADLREV